MSDAESPYAPSPELLSRGASRLLIVDMQQKLLPHIGSADLCLAHCHRLVRGASILEVPVIATEQYPQGLGPTNVELGALVTSPVEKVRFSAAQALGWTSGNDPEPERDQIVVAGIEAHVCVLQTVLDLLSGGFRVFVVADAIGSRHPFDLEIALRRMADSGAVLTTTESVLFEWCGVAGTPEFRQISALIKER